jgi:hypothetical protein
MWFAAIGKKEIGPLTLAQLQERLKKGLVSVRTYVWRDGLAHWTRLRDIPLLAALVPAEFLDGSALRRRTARRIVVASATGIAIVALAAFGWLRFGTAPDHAQGDSPVASSRSP